MFAVLVSLGWPTRQQQKAAKAK